MKKILLTFVLTFFTFHNCYAANQSQLELNKKQVIALYEEIINHKNFDAALKYIGPTYTQHNPLAADGTEGLKNYIQFLRAQYPAAHSDIKRVFAEGDYVVLHVHTVLAPNTRGSAIMDIFKLENGKVIEHWDVTQEIPEKAANENGMF